LEASTDELEHGLKGIVFEASETTEVSGGLWVKIVVEHNVFFTNLLRLNSHYLQIHAVYMNNTTLNDAQQQAVRTTDGPVLIIAGPGSSKTHTLVERILHLIADMGVDPRQILVSTFTEKAAAELITRLSNRLAVILPRFCGERVKRVGHGDARTQPD